LGQVVHATIRRAYQYAHDGHFTLDQLRQHYEEVWEVLRQPEVVQSSEYRTGLTIMENFYRTLEGTRARPVMLEQRFRVELGEHILTGQFDRVDLLEDTGGYEILDYKMNKVAASSTEVDQDWQLGLYCLAFEALQGVLPERVSLVYLRTGRKLSTARSRRQLADLLEEVRDTARQIQTEQQFTPCEGPWCKWCDYSDYCYLKVALPRLVEPAVVQGELPF
jgi:RecB family exonuclease